MGANNELRVTNVNDLNNMHAIYILGTDDDSLNVGNDFVRENEVRVSENLNDVSVNNANVYVSAASGLSMQNEYER